MACLVPAARLDVYTRSRKPCVAVKAAFSLIGRPHVGISRFGRKPDSLQRLNTSAVLEAPVTGERPASPAGNVEFQGVHHVALICANLEKSLAFYQGTLGLEINPDRPHSKLPYRGAWLWIGTEMIHLMELPNPDPLENRPPHGGRDRHVCIGVESIEPLVSKLEAAGVPLTRSMSGRPAIFFRDPDMNCLECVQGESWR